MTKIKRYSTEIANAAVVIGLVILAYELRQNTDQLAMELEWQINQKMFEINRDIQDEYTASIFAKSIIDAEELTFDEFLVVAGVLTNLLNVWEDRYFLYEQGMLDDSEWKDFIDRNIGFTLGNSYAQRYWHATKSLFQPELVEYVDANMPDANDELTEAWWLSVTKLPTKNSDQ